MDARTLRSYIAAMFRRICRRAIAFVVAYAVALNLIVPLLAAFASATEAAPAGLAELCAADQGGANSGGAKSGGAKSGGAKSGGAKSGGDGPGGHRPVCPFGPACLMQDCGANGLWVGGSQAFATVAIAATTVSLSIRWDDERIVLRAIGAQFARAPPRA